MSGIFVLMAENTVFEKGFITGDRVNIRGRPLGTAEICCKLDKGDPVEIVERRLVQTTGTNTEEWIRIVLPDKANIWLQSNLVDEKGAVTTRVNGRAGPSLMWPVLCVYSKGDVVNVRTNHLDWVGVIPSRNASAWVSGRYVQNGTPPTSTIPEAR